MIAIRMIIIALSSALVVSCYDKNPDHLKSCCKHNAPFNRTHHCTNGSSLIFHCSQGVTLLADSKGNPPEMFTIESGVLVLQGATNDKEYAEFCVNQMIWSEGGNNSEIHDVALVCSVEDDDDSWVNVFGVMQFISSAFLILTTIVYIYLTELREVQDICVLNFVINLSITYIILGTVQFAVGISRFSCTLLAYSLYWFSLCAFFWMNINSYNMWKSSKGWYTVPYKILAVYMFVCYGIPILCLIIIIILQNVPGDHLKPHFGSSVCFFEDRKTKWYYYYSILTVLLILNIIFFLDSARILWNTYRGPKQLNRIRSLRYKFCLYLKLFLVMGIPWCFEILTASVLTNLDVVVLITDIINSLQGLIIFIVLIVTRKRVRRLLARKNPCMLNCFPPGWTREADIETEEVLDEETHAMSTS